MKNNSLSLGGQSSFDLHASESQGRAVDWLYQTIVELSQAIPIQEQMFVSVLAAAWRPESDVWDSVELKALLTSFARDTDTATELKLDIALRSIESGVAVVEALTSAGVIGELTSEALRIAISKRQLDQFFSCWQKRPLSVGLLVPFEETFMSKLLRLAVTGLVVLNVLVFIMLFIIPEFQKMFEEFGIELTPAVQFLMIWSDRLAHFWFIPFFLMLVLSFLFFRGSSFGSWWRRWSTRLWTASEWNKKDRNRLVTAWELRPVAAGEARSLSDAGASAESKAETVRRWEQSESLAGVLTKSESAALSSTDDQELKDWLLERMIGSKRERRMRINSFWTTSLLGACHCFLGLIVLLLAISIFGTLLEVVYGLAGGRP